MTDRVKPASKWIWAVDAFHEQPVSQWRAVEALRSSLGGVQPAIQPVSCLALGQFNPGLGVFEEKWHRLAAHAEKKLESLLKQGEPKGLLMPRLLRQEDPVISFGVDALVRFALEEGAEGIVLTSHGRKGPARWVLGSFAETLVLRSPLPVLVVNPRAARPKRIKTIVFPTDFSAGSREAFGRTLAIASRIKAKIVLFHKVSTLYPEVGNATASGKRIDPVRERRDELKAEGAAWIAFAAGMGVKVRVILDLKTGRVLPALMRVIDSVGTDSMVAMASTSGLFKSLMLGSLSRQVLREARRPVLIFHAEQESLTEVFLAQLNRFAFAYAANPVVR